MSYNLKGLPRRSAISFEARGSALHGIESRNLSDLPEANTYVYIVKVEAHHRGHGEIGVKVGVTKNPSKRVRTHVNNARHFGLDISQVWVSNGPLEPSQAKFIERLLKIKDGNLSDEFVNAPFMEMVGSANVLASLDESIEKRLDPWLTTCRWRVPGTTYTSTTGVRFDR